MHPTSDQYLRSSRVARRSAQQVHHRPRQIISIPYPPQRRSLTHYLLQLRRLLSQALRHIAVNVPWTDDVAANIEWCKLD
jgi:hypothetical protein